MKLCSDIRHQILDIRALAGNFLKERRKIICIDVYVILYFFQGVRGVT